VSVSESLFLRPRTIPTAFCESASPCGRGRASSPAPAPERALLGLVGQRLQAGFVDALDGVDRHGVGGALGVEGAAPGHLGARALWGHGQGRLVVGDRQRAFQDRVGVAHHLVVAGDLLLLEGTAALQAERADLHAVLVGQDAFLDGRVPVADAAELADRLPDLGRGGGDVGRARHLQGMARHGGGGQRQGGKRQGPAESEGHRGVSIQVDRGGRRAGSGAAQELGRDVPWGNGLDVTEPGPRAQTTRRVGLRRARQSAPEKA